MTALDGKAAFLDQGCQRAATEEKKMARDVAPSADHTE
jgi:hypothetical protein